MCMQIHVCMSVSSQFFDLRTIIPNIKMWKLRFHGENDLPILALLLGADLILSVNKTQII